MNFKRLGQLAGVAAAVFTLGGSLLAFGDGRYAAKADVQGLQRTLGQLRIDTLQNRAVHLRDLKISLDADRTGHPLVAQRRIEIEAEIISLEWQLRELRRAASEGR